MEREAKQQTKQNELIKKLAEKEKNRAISVTGKFSSKYKIATEFDLNEEELTFFNTNFARYWVSKGEYKNNYNPNHPILFFAESFLFVDINKDRLNYARKIVSESFKEAIERERKYLEDHAREKGISGKIQKLAHLLSDSFLDYPKNPEKIKKDILEAKQWFLSKGVK